VTSRLAEVLTALCERQPRYACFLWTAARNLVLDVIGHVASADLQPRVDDSEGDEAELENVGRQQRRRVAAELQLFNGDDTQLACKTLFVLE